MSVSNLTALQMQLPWYVLVILEKQDYSTRTVPEEWFARFKCAYVHDAIGYPKIILTPGCRKWRLCRVSTFQRLTLWPSQNDWKRMVSLPAKQKSSFNISIVIFCF